MSGAKLTYKGIADMTPGQTSSENATNEAEMSGLEPENSKNQSSRRKKVVMIVIREVLIMGRKSLH